MCLALAHTRSSHGFVLLHDTKCTNVSAWFWATVILSLVLAEKILADRFMRQQSSDLFFSSTSLFYTFLTLLCVLSSCTEGIWSWSRGPLSLVLLVFQGFEPSMTFYCACVRISWLTVWCASFVRYCWYKSCTCAGVVSPESTVLSVLFIWYLKCISKFNKMWY